ncbi:MAG TPA: tocopherol cyclase family protein [Bacteroidales bacterium]|nr:tocopherol cyclase family protein [Bacteroidales bacterium]
MLYRLYNPSIFQGNLRKKNYFEGWYFKHVSAGLNYVFSFIPGISLNEKDPHAFIQVINGATGESDYITYPLSSFSWSRIKFRLSVGNSVFTDQYISLDIKSENLTVYGRIDYSNVVKYPSRVFSPGIMGWYSFVPFMECKHGIVSVNHDLTGGLFINDQPIDFDYGKGYIEKDWGTSFPESWLWIQANNFNDHNSCLHFSVAKVPWRGKYFIGFICLLYYNRKFFLFSTYNNSKITEINHTGNSVFIVIENKRNKLKIYSARSISGELKAPVDGSMTRKIRESIDSRVSIALYNSDNKVVYTDSSSRAGIELIEKIFEYFNDGKTIQKLNESHTAATIQNGR